MTDNAEQEHPTKDAISAAMRLLVDDRIPWEHAPDQPNCGECWQCIYATLSIVHVLRTDRRRADIGRTRTRNQTPS